MGETMMLGLRLLREGVSYQRFHQLHHVSMQHIYGSEMQRLSAQGLLSLDDQRALLTDRGLEIGNQVFLAFLPD